MNQVKIGKFIAELRKSKNMTQEQLGEKLSVSFKTISKWENGRGMPDTSNMIDLCNELGISVNELLSGMKLDECKYKENAEENLIELQRKQENAKKAYHRVEKIWLIIAILLVPIHFAINYYYPENNGTGIGQLIWIIGLILFSFHFIQYYKIEIKIK